VNRPLTTTELAELARAVSLNALDLMDESSLLLAAGHNARALALAVLAEEEFGKFVMCHGAAPHAGKDREYWHRWWKRFRKHNMKALVAYRIRGDALQDLDEWEKYQDDADLAEGDQEAKFAALYVDFSSRVERPSETTVEQARTAHDRAADLIRPSATFWKQADFEELFAKASTHGRPLAEAMEAQSRARS